MKVTIHIVATIVGAFLCVPLFLGYACHHITPDFDRDERVDFVFNLDTCESENVEPTVYTDLRFIPLDNKRECLLSNVGRLKVTDVGFYIFNDTELPSVFLFNEDGSFNHQVGEVGRSKSEYQNIMDITANHKGDTVAIMTLTDVKLYDMQGRFLSFFPNREKQRWENILYTPAGFICSRNYRGADCLVAIYDKKFSGKRKLVPANEEWVTGEPPYTNNVVQSDGEYLCYLDMFNSSFYVMKKDCLNRLCQYKLTSEKILSLDNFAEKGRDYIYSYILANHVIKGRMLYEDDSIGFEIDLEHNTFRFCETEGLFVSFMDYHQGYYYSIVKPTDILNYHLNDEVIFLNQFTPSIDSLRKAFAPYKDQLSEKNNYYVLKMKAKK